MDQESPIPPTTTTQNSNPEKTSHDDDSHTRPHDGFGTSPGKFNIRDSVDEVIDNLQKVISNQEEACGYATGFQDLDQIIGGLRPGKMFVIASRPSMGKTSLMLNMVEHICIDQKVPTLVFSGDLSAFEVVQRILFNRAKFAMSRLYCRNDQPTKADLLRIRQAAIEISDSNLFVDDTNGIYIETLRATARLFKQEHQNGFIAVDHLQLIQSDTPQTRQSREREVADVSSGIKNMAKELGVPVLVLSQLNRKPESRSGSILGLPRMSDLRDSGAIENDADMIGLLYRASYYAESVEDREAELGKTVLIIAKNRNGDTGWVGLTFVGELMRFESIERQMEEW